MSSSSHGFEYATGAIHGRFQPFHSGHMRYLNMALERAHLVYIGITNPDAPHSTQYDSADPVRHLISHNPLTYDERAAIISMALHHLRDFSVASRVRIVRFDVNGDPALWQETIPREAVQFVVPHEPWDEEKAERFLSAGYQVEFLPTEVNRVTATLVRGLIRAGNASWRDHLPHGVAAQLQQSGLINRISLARTEQ